LVINLPRQYKEKAPELSLMGFCVNLHPILIHHLRLTLIHPNDDVIFDWQPILSGYWAEIGCKLGR